MVAVLGVVGAIVGTAWVLLSFVRWGWRTGMRRVNPVAVEVERIAEEPWVLMFTGDLPDCSDLIATQASTPEVFRGLLRRGGVECRVSSAPPHPSINGPTCRQREEHVTLTRFGGHLILA